MPNTELPRKTKTAQDFRLFLQDELARRCARNPNYSLRSFAKHLKVSPSALSAMLNDKRPITHRMKERLGLMLGLTLGDLERLSSCPHGNSHEKRKTFKQIHFQQVATDAFAIISEPHHYAFLELMKLKNFAWDKKWIAHKLKLTVSEVNITIERLERAGLLCKNEEGVLEDASEGFSTDLREGLSTQAQRLFQKRSLQQASVAMDQIPVTQRDNTSMIMAVQSKDMAKAKQMIKDFRRQFCVKMEDGKSPDEVYQLIVSFIPLTDTTGVEK